MTTAPTTTTPITTGGTTTTPVTTVLTTTTPVTTDDTTTTSTTTAQTTTTTIAVTAAPTTTTALTTAGITTTSVTTMLTTTTPVTTAETHDMACLLLHVVRREKNSNLYCNVIHTDAKSLPFLFGSEISLYAVVHLKLKAVQNTQTHALDIIEETFNVFSVLCLTR